MLHVPLQPYYKRFGYQLVSQAFFTTDVSSYRRRFAFMYDSLCAVQSHRRNHNGDRPRFQCRYCTMQGLMENVRRVNRQWNITID